jgi:predicted ATPase/class 3 adenylate cyclase
MALAALLPTGAVTFAFSDIEGSTTRWELYGAAMQDAVRRHDAIMRAAIAQHHGHVFRTAGDAFCAAFTRPEDALAAMIAAQETLAAEDFSTVDGLRVRVALHTGTAEERDGDYFGPALDRVARLLGIGHGGQVLLSSTTRELARSNLPRGATLLDLGSHRPRGTDETEYVWQLEMPGLPDAFPPLRSLDALPNNLPTARSSFVGRELDVADVEALLDRHSVLTLVGSGGVGKTRLAIQVGAALLDRYPDGVWLVDLASIGDPELAASVVAQTLGMSQRQGQRVDEAIPPWLRRKKLLLILDNCEHVLQPVAALAHNIITVASDVRILATSRQSLNISGEAVHVLPPLGFPAADAAVKAEDAQRYGAVALFVDRAKAADTRFVLTDETAPVVAEICRRLDGIALAIELAAARVKVLSIPSLAQRLNERFKLLAGGSRDVLPRQKTLTALIGWSYDLLTAQEQRLFNHLGVFFGGFGLEAATAVCDDGLDEFEVLDLLSSLADKSMLVTVHAGDQARYRLLESTAAYALEKLAATGDRERLVRRHAQYFRERAKAGQRAGTGSTVAWLAAVELDLGNYRAALEWALTQNNDAALGGAIAGALEQFWFGAGLSVEGRYWTECALERIDETEEPAVAAALHLAFTAGVAGQRPCDAARKALHLFESVGDGRGAARARQRWAQALLRMGRLEEARETATQALAASRASGNEGAAASCLILLAIVEWHQGNLQPARELLAQALVSTKALGDELETASVLGVVAELEFAAGDPERALQLANEALGLAFLDRPSSNVAVWHMNSAAYRIALGDIPNARHSAREALRFARHVQHEDLIALVLQRFASIAALTGDRRRGARLLGYVNARWDALGMKREPTERWEYDKLLVELRAALSEGEIEELQAEGAQFSEDRAVTEALA